MARAVLDAAPFTLSAALKPGFVVEHLMSCLAHPRRRLACVRRMNVIAARHESFLKAARELSVTPGAVSRVVKELEAHIGVQLFVRGTRGVRLTAAARRYAGDLAPAIGQIALACARVRMSRLSAQLS